LATSWPRPPCASKFKKSWIATASRLLLFAYFFLLEELLFFDELELELEDEPLLLESAAFFGGGIEFGSRGCTVTCIEA
jgi:hypothetical protein